MIENTSQRDPFLHLLGAVSEGSSGYIENMEAEGQRQLVNSDVLPVDAPWTELEELGFTRTDPSASDDLFVNCTLPEGWRREGSDHAMWSYIVDERGIRRVAVFYKAAFYDRRAFARIEQPGRVIASSVIYGDGPVELPQQWGLLTEEERADLRTDCESFIREEEEWGETLPSTLRARRLLELAQS